MTRRRWARGMKVDEERDLRARQFGGLHARGVHLREPALKVHPRVPQGLGFAPRSVSDEGRCALLERSVGENGEVERRSERGAVGDCGENGIALFCHRSSGTLGLDGPCDGSVLFLSWITPFSHGRAQFSNLGSRGVGSNVRGISERDCALSGAATILVFAARSVRIGPSRRSLSNDKAKAWATCVLNGAAIVVANLAKGTDQTSDASRRQVDALG
jgi:hypothetical protein